MADKQEASRADGGFVGRIAFVTLPMVVTAAMLLLSKVAPVPMEGAPLEPEPADAATARVSYLQAELFRAQADARMTEWKVHALEDAMRRGPGPVEAWVDSLGGQSIVALGAAAFGALSLAGPSGFTRFALALVGSAIGGLFVATFANLLSGSSGSPFWVDSVWALTGGRGRASDYVVWITLFVLGMLRWATGWQCRVVMREENDNEVEFDISGTITMHKDPVTGEFLPTINVSDLRID